MTEYTEEQLNKIVKGLTVWAVICTYSIFALFIAIVVLVFMGNWGYAGRCFIVMALISLAISFFNWAKREAKKDINKLNGKWTKN